MGVIVKNDKFVALSRVFINLVYFQLFKSHMEMMERTKAMMSTEKSENESSVAERSVLFL